MNLVRKNSLILIMILVLALVLSGCGREQGAPEEGPKVNEPGETKELTLATTTSTYDSGLLDFMLPYFEEENNYNVKVVSLGTGAALELGKSGDCDVVLVHARDLELEFVEEGYFINREDVMYNDFVIVGAESDPAGIAGTESISEMLAAIKATESNFISRGDDSGTHMKELSLWENSGIEASGSWYLKVGSSMGDTLRMADEMLGYTLTDRGSYLSLMDSLELKILFAGDEELFNPYSIMAVSPELHSHVDINGANLLIEFFTTDDGKDLIEDFAINGEQLFFISE